MNKNILRILGYKIFYGSDEILMWASQRFKSRVKNIIKLDEKKTMESYG